jgi:hypothetical protein
MSPTGLHRALCIFENMLFRIIAICILSSSVNAFAQNEKDDDYVNDNVFKHDDYIYKSSIRTVQFHEASWEYGAPVISLYGNEKLQLNFDDLDGDQKQYSISFVHCNADWTPSDLMISEYLNGFYDINILNFGYAVSTFQKYTHYSIVFPQAGTQNNTQFIKSGNYILYVYANADKNDLVLSRRFMVYDNKLNIGATFRQSAGDGEQFKKQHIDFTVASAGYDMNNPQRDMKVIITQNNRWDNAITDIKPTFINGNQFIFSLDDKSTFNGGNEFRFFDIRSLRFMTEQVNEIYRDDNFNYHVRLQPDKSRANKAYLFYNDFNGNFLIRNRETRGNMDFEADYVYVHFSLPFNKPVASGNFYILGKLTDWRMNKLSKMVYNYDRNAYEAKLYLKQGYYNYIYVLSNDSKSGGDQSLTEGNHWDTENDYCIYVYHRKFGTYYDQLIGYQKLNSLKR